MVELDLKAGLQVEINGHRLEVANWRADFSPGFSTPHFQIDLMPASESHPACKSVLTPQKEETMNTASRIKELALDDDTRLLRKYDIVDSKDNLTDEGAEVLLALLFEQNREAVIDKLKALEKADDEAA